MRWSGRDWDFPFICKLQALGLPLVLECCRDIAISCLCWDRMLGYVTQGSHPGVRRPAKQVSQQLSNLQGQLRWI